MGFVAQAIVPAASALMPTLGEPSLPPGLRRHLIQPPDPDVLEPRLVAMILQ